MNFNAWKFVWGSDMAEGLQPIARNVHQVPPPLYAAIFGPDDGSDLDREGGGRAEPQAIMIALVQTCA